MQRIMIKPQNNLKVYNPISKKFIAPEGEIVLESTYWLRLERQGDIKITLEKPEGGKK
jgi:hypothetical protein